jgi:replicative DNA helicase
LINEIRVISAVINEKDIAPLINGSHVDQLFQSYGDVWSYIKEYYTKHRSIVPADILSERFTEKSHSFKLIETSGTVKHYLEQLRDEYTTTMIEKIARGMANDVGSKPNAELLGNLQRRLTEISKVSSAVRDLDITDADKAVDHFTEIKRKMAENGGVLGIRTGFDSIDANYPTGFGPGQYIMIISRTNQGKSWLALELAINAWRQGKKVLYVSLEMSPELVRNRAYALMSTGQFNMSDLSRAEIDLDSMKIWTNDKLGSDNSFVVIGSEGMGGFNNMHLQSKIDQYGPEIVFVDYMQLQEDNRNSSGETERVRNVSKENKSTAMTNDIPVVCVASASSNETKEYFTPPQIYEVAGSRQSAFDADLVLALISHKQRDGTSLTEVIARKNRHGPLFNFMLCMDIANGTIKEVWAEPDEEE